MVIPYALGQNVTFKENVGPILNPISKLEDLDFRNTKENLRKLSPCFETIRIINKKKNDKKIIGFCGGPLTVLTYMIEGGTSKDHSITKKKIKEEKKKMLDIINVLVELSSVYLCKQIESGADIVKIFESWAGILDGDDYENFVIKPNMRIVNKIKEQFPQIPVVCFPRRSGNNVIDFMNKVKCDVLSLDDEFPKEILQIAKQRKIILQGNLNPQTLFVGGKKLEEEIKKIMLLFKDNNHIFNLSHGILPQTPIKNVETTIKLIRKYDETK